MSENTGRPSRSLDAIQRDFNDLVASKLTGDIARDKFERLWDETNVIAAKTVTTPEGDRCIALLKQMHQIFDTTRIDTRPPDGYHRHH